LSQYKDDSSDDDLGEKVLEDKMDEDPKPPTTPPKEPPSAPIAPIEDPVQPSSPVAEPPPSTPAVPSSPPRPSTPTIAPIPTINFYASSVSKGKQKEKGDVTDRKRKSPDGEDDNDASHDVELSKYARTPLPVTPRKKPGNISPLSRSYRNNKFKGRAYPGVTIGYTKPRKMAL